MKDDENKGKEEGADGDKPKVIADAFGTPRDAGTGERIAPPPPKAKEDDDKGDKDGKGKDDAGKGADDDIENNPVVVGLKQALEDVKKDMGGNLSGQRKVIERLEGELKDLREGKKSGVKPMFEDIKRVKDLPKEQQEAMSEAEKTTFDALADTREAMNKLVADQAAKDAASDKTAKELIADEDAQEALDAKVQPLALKLAGNDQKVANQIIANMNLFKDNDKLTDKELEARVEQAARMISDYKPPKEQARARGGAVKSGGDAEDPFGSRAIIDQAKGGNKGNYSL